MSGEWITLPEEFINMYDTDGYKIKIWVDCTPETTSSEKFKRAKIILKRLVEEDLLPGTTA